VSSKRALPGRRPTQRPERIDLDDVVYGVHAVEEALAGDEVLRKIHVGDERKRDPALRALLERAREREVPVFFEPRAFFAQFPYRAHQQVVAFGEPFGYVSLEEALAARRPGQAALVVVLDHITDPHNAGAIIRSAECAGADAVVLPERRSAGINATVRKAAAGATAHLPIARVANVAEALRRLKKAGLWVAGAAVGHGALPYTRADFDRDLVLVIGAEGEGISPVVRGECDFLVEIPLSGRIESLNASVAAAVLLFEARRQRAAQGD
jgi:23S rRNA (guanosine2251-2'-O)-methyltransferase